MDKSLLFFNKKNIFIFISFLITLLISASVIIKGFNNLQWLKTFFSTTSYYIILLLTIAWAVSLLQAYRSSSVGIVAFWKTHHKAIILTFLATSLVFISVARYYRVLSDETNLLSVARTMTFEKRVENITEGKWYYEMFWPQHRTIDKRPLLFPFFTHLTHTIAGYNPENVFILNFLALWGLLFLVYLILQKYIGPIGGAVGVVLILAQPIVTLCSTSGGFEIFNALFLAASFLSLRWFLSTRSLIAFQVLFMNLLMLANIRYESILFLFVIVFFLAIGGYLKKELLASPLVAAAPVFLLPWIVQRMIFLTHKDVNMKGHSWVDSFQVSQVGKSITLFFQYSFNVEGKYGYAGLINYLGFMSAIFITSYFFCFRKEISRYKNEIFFFSVCLISLILQFFVVLSYDQGAVNFHPMNGRFYLAILILFSIFPVFAFSLILQNKFSLFANYLLIVAAAFFVFYHPIAMEDRIANNLFIIRENRFVRDFLHTQADKNALIVCDRPGQLIIYNRGAISFSRANKEKMIILNQYQNHLFSHIYVIQDIAYATGLPLKNYTIDPMYQLEPVAQLQTTGRYFVNISRVKIPEYSQEFKKTMTGIKKGEINE